MLKKSKFDILVSPLTTEKSVNLNGLSKYVFRVAASATKKMVKKVVEELFNTKVIAVNILNTKDKIKYFKGRKGKRSGFKKAIVTLEAGKTIDLTIGA
jgi:large subunit ribosomal protein L23